MSLPYISDHSERKIGRNQLVFFWYLLRVKLSKNPQPKKAHVDHSKGVLFETLDRYCHFKILEYPTLLLLVV